MMLKAIIFTAVLGVTLSFVTADAAASDRLLEKIGGGGHVMMIRHANAPGTGDPDHFRIGDCSTQRNLDDRGRAQARRIANGCEAGG
ncbi:hypothetical protein DSCA_43180 [Desulfosarcina alkanivorans]|uniref:Histidine phosphatase family protein n=1 Tax=Desulfosarcina alkanivorans TaxID=571177 RepID=A0A5K7YNK6_9BACT|nr:hypothetical protein [Desulfosarcina alkanivorans]BBO70388.1 hypothetical protein DSCA_43180 [Desulfosarcina alkanivorans]